MTWAIAQATASDACHIAEHMSPADAAEVWAAAHRTPLEALLNSMAMSLESWTWHVDSEPACMFGFAAPSLLGDWANPWMLGTPLVKCHRFAFLRNYRAQIDAMLNVYPLLVTYVDCRHAVCLRWLKWTGFYLWEPEPYGADGLPFCKCTLGGIAGISHLEGEEVVVWAQ